MKRVCLEYFEGDFARCETTDGTMVTIARKGIPVGTKEGDILIIQDDGTILIDKKETKDRRAKIATLQDELFC